MVQPANAAVTEVCRRVTVQVRGRKGNREWELRNRLTRCAARLPGDLVAELEGLHKKIGVPILAAVPVERIGTDWNGLERQMVIGSSEAASLTKIGAK